MSDFKEMNPVFEGLKPSSTLFINETVNRLWQEGQQVFHMGFGESRFNVHPAMRAALADHSDKKSYLPARGLPELTEAVAHYYSTKLDQQFEASQVMIGPGSKALIYALQMALDADVFLPTPSWVSYGPQAILLGRNHFYIPSKLENDYCLEIAELDKLVQASTRPCKLLIINSPNNPSGQMLSDAFLQELAVYCRRNNVLVLSDEIYFQVCFGGREHVSISKYYPEGTFVLGGLSKHLSIGGWRLGVALLPDTEFGRALMDRMTMIASEVWSGVSAPIQYAAVLAYSLDSVIEKYISDCSAIHGIRSRYCQVTLSNLGVSCSRVEGAFYITANFDSFASGLASIGVRTSADLAAHLLNEYRIASLPGSDFGIPEELLTLRLSTSYLDMQNSEDAQRIFDLYTPGVDPTEFMSVENHPVTHAALTAFSKFLKSLSN
ncbi:MAG: aspartate aminotransferase [Arenicella sp.]|jgi:aspartate aminotransferase